MDQSRKLKATELTYNLRTEFSDAATGKLAPGQGLQKFYRFERPVELHGVEIPINSYARANGLPKHIRILVYDECGRGKAIFDRTVSESPDGQPLQIDLPATRTLVAAIYCDESYPFKEWLWNTNWPATHTIPYVMFEGAKFAGIPLAEARFEPPYQPPLAQEKVEPRALDGQSIEVDFYEIRFASPFLQAGFSLRRPMMTFLGWDGLGKGLAAKNLLSTVAMNPSILRSYASPLGNGPMLRHPLFDAAPRLWTGTVEVAGNRVTYRNVSVTPGWTLDVSFEVGLRELHMAIAQRVERNLTLIDAAAWTFLWNGKDIGSLATLAMPLDSRGRVGRTGPMGGWAATCHGALLFHPASNGGAISLQNDSTTWDGRTYICGWQVGVRHEPDGLVTLRAGTHQAQMQFRVGLLTPAVRAGVPALPDGLAKTWGSVFGFRPEAGGYSNNSFSIFNDNCLYLPTDLAIYTKQEPNGPDVVELARWSLITALQGSAQGCFRHWDDYMDSCPSLVVTAERIHRVRPNKAWLQEQWYLLRKPIDQILKCCGGSGLYTTADPRRTGNYGDRLWSNMAWDATSIAYQDSYSNALAYRALRGAAALARVAGDADTATRCRAAAEKIKSLFYPTFFNPDTGWIATWKSKDGQLHDQGMPIVTGMAACLELVDRSTALAMLMAMEKRRQEMGFEDFRYGLPVSLLPFKYGDYSATGSGQPQREDGLDSFGVFCNGCVTPSHGYFYLHALSTHGFTDIADRICRDMLRGFDRQYFEGVLNGREYYTFDGQPCGYEGTLTHNYHILLAIAQHLNLVETLDPEWWPADQ